MKTNFSEWLQMKYIEWMAKEGVIRTQREFADYLDIDKVTLSRYINAKRKHPDPLTIDKLADKLGPETYDILGLARPDPMLQQLTSVWHRLSEEKKHSIMEIALNGRYKEQ